MNLIHSKVELPIKGELLSIERLEEYAGYLAAHLPIADTPPFKPRLLERMRDNGAALLVSYRALTDAIHRKENLH